MADKRTENFPNLTKAECAPNCKVAITVNKIRDTFNSDMPTAALKDRARIAMGHRQFCPLKETGGRCQALRYKHYILTLILDKMDDHGNKVTTTRPLQEPTTNSTNATTVETQTPPMKFWGCTVCFEDLMEKKPMALECGHLMCQECCAQMSRLDTNMARKRQGKIACAVCKHECVPIWLFPNEM